MKHITNLSFLIVLFFSWPAWGVTYYVKTAGNDSFDGLSDATAWATIAKVKATVKSGDTVFFRSQDTWTGSPTSGLSVLSATAGVSYDGSTYGSGTRATIRPLTVHTGVVSIYESNVTFKGFEIDGNRINGGGIYVGYHTTQNVDNVMIDNCVVHNIGSDDTYQYGIHIGSVNGYKVSNVIVLNTTVNDTMHEGIAVYPSWQYENNKIDTVVIRNCTVYNTGMARADRGYGEGISVCNNSSNVTIESNHCYNTLHGILINNSTQGVNGSPTNLIVRYNIIRENTMVGIYVQNLAAGSFTGSFYGNLIYNNGKRNTSNFGAEVTIDGTNMSSSVLSFYNNTIYSTTNPNDKSYGVSVGYSYPITGTPTFNFKNNIIYTGNYIPILDSQNLLTHSNNLVFRSSGSSDTHITAPAGKNYDRAGVITWETTAKNTDPRFTGGTLPTGFTGSYGPKSVPNTNYFSITSGDALDNGETLGSAGSAYNGCINKSGVRPAEAYDIGAYENITFPATISAPKGLQLQTNN